MIGVRDGSRCRGSDNAHTVRYRCRNGIGFVHIAERCLAGHRWVRWLRRICPFVASSLRSSKPVKASDQALSLSTRQARRVHVAGNSHLTVTRAFRSGKCRWRLVGRRILRRRRSEIDWAAFHPAFLGRSSGSFLGRVLSLGPACAALLPRLWWQDGEVVWRGKAPGFQMQLLSG